MKRPFSFEYDSSQDEPQKCMDCTKEECDMCAEPKDFDCCDDEPDCTDDEFWPEEEPLSLQEQLWNGGV
jgi:hypothetical protein